MVRKWFLVLLIPLFMLLMACGDNPTDLGDAQLDEKPDTLAPTSTYTITTNPTETPTPVLTPTPTYTSLPSNTPTRTPTPKPIELIRVMQYNIFYGGGYSKGRCLNLRGYEYGNTSELITQIILTANPDVLVVNEACDFDNPQVAIDFANMVGLQNYYIGEDYIDWKAPVAVYVRDGFRIVEAESLKYSDEINESTIFRGLRVKVETPHNNEMTIIGVHLSPFLGDVETAVQAEWLVEVMKPYDDQLSILTGDMNEPLSSSTARTFRADNWYVTSPLYSSCGYPRAMGWICEIDQIWIKPSPQMQFHRSPEAEEMRNSLRFYNPALLDKASDHRPQADVIAIYPP